MLRCPKILGTRFVHDEPDSQTVSNIKRTEAKKGDDEKKSRAPTSFGAETLNTTGS